MFAAAAPRMAVFGVTLAPPGFLGEERGRGGRCAT
jgi:hypothetical protein